MNFRQNQTCDETANAAASRRPQIRRLGRLPAMLWSLGLVSCIAKTVFAVEVKGAVSVNSQYTDNSRKVDRHAVGEQVKSDWINSPELDLSVLEVGPLLNATADTRLERRHYAHNTFSDDTLVTGAAHLDAAVIGERLRWLLDDTRTQTSINSQLQDVPNNQQITNVLSSGPQLRWALNPRTNVSSSLRYASVNSNRTGNDSARWSLDGQGVRRLNGANSVGLKLNLTKVNFLSSNGIDNRRVDVRATYSRESGERLKLDVELGGVTIDNTGGRTSRNAVGAITGNYKFAPQWSGNLQMTRNATDQSLQSLSGSRQFGQNFTQGSDTPGTFVESEARAGVHHQGARLDGNFSLGWLHQNFLDVRRDETRRTANLRFEYRLGPRVSLDASGEVQVIDRQTFSGHDIERDAELRISWRPEQHLTLAGGVGARARESQRIISRYRERHATVSLAYRF